MDLREYSEMRLNGLSKIAGLMGKLKGLFKSKPVAKAAPAADFGRKRFADATKSQPLIWAAKKKGGNFIRTKVRDM